MLYVRAVESVQRRIDPLLPLIDGVVRRDAAGVPSGRRDCGRQRGRRVEERIAGGRERPDERRLEVTERDVGPLEPRPEGLEQRCEVVVRAAADREGPFIDRGVDQHVATGRERQALGPRPGGFGFIVLRIGRRHRLRGPGLVVRLARIRAQPDDERHAREHGEHREADPCELVHRSSNVPQYALERGSGTFDADWWVLGFTDGSAAGEQRGGRGRLGGRGFLPRVGADAHVRPRAGVPAAGGGRLDAVRGSSRSRDGDRRGRCPPVGRARLRCPRDRPASDRHRAARRGRRA